MQRRHMYVVVPVIVLATVLIVWFAAHTARRVELKRYSMTATVVQVQAADQMVEAHNEDIPGFMTPMNMDYLVKDQRLLSNLRPGDKIHATLVSDGQNTWELQDVTVTQHAGESAAPANPTSNSNAPAPTSSDKK
ncbi:MAG TPA: copper-binding protein [Terriglobales bacterium]|nr:copper-binding protein [Terriglobales bacterium]